MDTPPPITDAEFQEMGEQMRQFIGDMEEHAPAAMTKTEPKRPGFFDRVGRILGLVG